MVVELIVNLAKFPNYNLKKMKNLIFTTAVALNILSGVESKDHFIVKPEIHRSESHNRPEVQAYNCRTCLVESDNTNVCLTYGANFKIGW